MSGDTKRTQGWRPVPNTPYALVVQPEADRGLKILPVWVRIPSRVPGILLIPHIFTDKAERRLTARTDLRNGLTECGHSPGYRPKEA